MDIDLKQLKELMRAIRQLDISEVEVRKGEESVRLKREVTTGTAARTQPSLMPSSMDVASMHPTATASTPPPEAKEDPSIGYVTSPFVGTFYTAPAPDAPVFVQVNHSFNKGQVLCIVEAMKLMNEIEADCDGTLLEVLAENGKPVEYGDKLFKIRKS